MTDTHGFNLAPNQAMEIDCELILQIAEGGVHQGLRRDQAIPSSASSPSTTRARSRPRAGVTTMHTERVPPRTRSAAPPHC
ncbi:MAG: hypothetical protein IPK80_35320 [Nannocystis sp.]|nr:hypothetical protein [Nannocystis sp.]